MAALDKHIDKRTRKDHLDVIGFLYRAKGYNEAMTYWLRNSHRISRAAAEKAMGL